MMESPDTTSHFRYPGVKPFTAEEQDLFFGRDKDIDALFNLIFVKQAVVLYGKSGYGKSSLINAGLIPKIQVETRYTCFPIRFNNYSKREEVKSISPVTTVRNRLIAAFQSETPITSPLDILVHQENSFWYWLKTYQWQHPQMTQFILFFDQFEELFTYPLDQINEFSEQLALLLYPSVPLHFRQRMIELAGADILKDSILYQKLDIKVVFSVRSDRLSLLNELTERHPAILQNCYQLNDLSREQAEKAITVPALKTTGAYISPTFTYTPDAIKVILDKVTDSMDGIELATLQILCRYIEEKLVAKRLNVEISREDLGDITDIFRKYYENILSRFTKTDRLKVQRLIEDELIDNGRRNPLSDNYILNKFGIGPTLLAQLEETSLLRKERDANGRLLYEVSHDTLIVAIEKVAILRRTLEAEVKQKEAAQEVAQKEAEAKYAKILVFITAFAILAATVAIGFGIRFYRATQNVSTQLLASVSDKLPPDQGLRLLEEIAKHNQDSSIYDDYIVNIFNKFDQERFILKTLDYQDYINAVAFSPDGKRILTISNKSAKIWTSKTKKPTLLDSLPHRSTIRSATFSSNGKRILTVTEDDIASIWDVSGKRPVVLDHQGSVRFATFSPDDNLIVIAARDSTVQLWNRNPQAKRLEKLANKGSFRFFAFSPDGSHIVTASDGTTAQIWNIKAHTSKPLTHQDSVYSATFSPDGRRIVTVSRDKKAKIWNIEAEIPKPLDSLIHQSIVRTAAFSSDGERIVTASEDNTAKVWTASGQLLTTLTHQDVVHSAIFSNDRKGSQIMTISKYKTARIASVWDVQIQLLDTLKHDHGIVHCANYSPNGEWIVTASEDKMAKIWTKQGQLKDSLKHTGTIRFVAFSPDGHHVVTASDDSTAKIWDIEGIIKNTAKKAKFLARLTHKGRIRSATFSPNGKWILTASEDNTARIWDAKTYKSLYTQRHKNHVYSALFSLDSKQIVTASRDKTVKVWTIVDTTLAHFELESMPTVTLNHQSAVRFATFSPDGERIVTASEDNSARIWDNQGHLQDSLQHQGIVYSVTFSPFGGQMVTASKDNTAKIWDIKSTKSKLLATLNHKSTVRFAAFSPDGNHIMTASEDAMAIIWYTAEGALKWLKENNDKVPLLSEENKKKYEIDN